MSSTAGDLNDQPMEWFPWRASRLASGVTTFTSVELKVLAC